VVAGLSTVREVGPVVADGQSVTEFDGTASGSIATQIFVAADGLLVRAVQRFGSETDTSDASLSARVVVHRPPASECVDYSRLTRSQQHAVANLAP
jgi:hypothetical protein